MAKLEIPVKCEIELNEDDRKLLRRFVDAVEAIQPPTIEVTHPVLSDEERQNLMNRCMELDALL